MVTTQVNKCEDNKGQHGGGTGMLNTPMFSTHLGTSQGAGLQGDRQRGATKSFILP